MIMATSLLLGACNPATDVNVKETGDKNQLSGSSDIRITDGRMTPEKLCGHGTYRRYERISGRDKKWCIRWRTIVYRSTAATVRSS